MPQIDVNRKRNDSNAQVDLEKFWIENKNLNNPHNTLLPITWGQHASHAVSKTPDQEHDLFIPLGKNSEGYVTFDLNLGLNILAGSSMLSGVGMFRRVSLVSLLKKHTPETMKVILVDLKKLMSDFDSIQHLLFPRATTMDDVTKVFEWCQIESDNRLDILKKSNT